MIIALEGLPGWGKTTLSKSLASEMTAISVPEFVPESWPNVRETAGGTYEDETIYLLNCEIKSTVEGHFPDSIVVLDRYYLTPLAINFTQFRSGLSNNWEMVSAWYESSVGTTVIRPSLYITCDIPIEECNERKGRSECDLLTWGVIDRLAIAADFYTNFFNSWEPDIPCLRLDFHLTRHEMASVAKYTIELLREGMHEHRR
ncbi:MAG: hypothetical protein JNJ45_01730 [Chthonomonas sp.]|nr:hypothetical protein [Chthonomonas sp.]